MKSKNHEVTESAPKTPKGKKEKPSAKPAARTHYDVYSKSRGYICTCVNENALHKTLMDLYRENDRFWRQAANDGKKTKAFDCYGLARMGDVSRVINLTFAANEDDEETFEDAIAEGNA
jgi:hypothetical protein